MMKAITKLNKSSLPELVNDTPVTYWNKFKDTCYCSECATENIADVKYYSPSTLDDECVECLISLAA